MRECPPADGLINFLLKEKWDLAKKSEYPDVPSYCKDFALEVRTYRTIVDKISKMDKDTTFALGELVDTPPSNLGVMIRKIFQNRLLH